MPRPFFITSTRLRTNQRIECRPKKLKVEIKKLMSTMYTRYSRRFRLGSRWSAWGSNLAKLREA